MERNKLPLTVTLTANLKRYIDPKTGPFFEKTLIKPTPLAEKAIEDFIKASGNWDHYQEFCAKQEAETY